MIIKFREHWIDPEQIESVRQGSRYNAPACTIVFQSGRDMDVMGSADDVIDEISEVLRKHQAAVRPQAPSLGEIPWTPGPGHEQLVQGGH